MCRVIAFVVVLLAWCACAEAATVTAREYEELTKVEETVTLTDVEYQADPGEVNVVRLWVEGDRLRIVDSGAPLRAVGLCEQVDAHEASCPRIGGIPLAMGDGDDTVATPLDDRNAPAVHVVGGEGDDRLSGAGELDGGPGADTMTLGIIGRGEGWAQGSRGRGGEGDDTIIGSGGGDVLRGGGGRNTLLAGADDDYVFEGDTRGAADRDVLDGGAGEDWLGYATHDEDLFADLRSSGQQITAVPRAHLTKSAASSRCTREPETTRSSATAVGTRRSPAAPAMTWFMPVPGRTGSARAGATTGCWPPATTYCGTASHVARVATAWSPRPVIASARANAPICASRHDR